MTRRCLAACCGSILVIAGRGVAQDDIPVLPEPAAVAELEAAFRGFLADPLLRHARVGLRVEEPGREVPLFDHDGEVGFLPASNMKLITSAVALRVLGEAFRFQTRFELRGEQRGDALVGDVVLVGAGDPTLGAPAFEPQGWAAPFQRLAAELRRLGVRRIEGRVLGDDDCQPDEIMGRGWDWSYHAEGFAAQVSGLCYHENCVALIYGVDAGDRSLELRLEPATSFVRVESLVRLPAAGARGATEIVIERSLGGNRIVASGVLAGVADRRELASVDNPTAFAAAVCSEVLTEAGIAVTGGAADLDGAGLDADARPRRLLYLHESPPLAAIVLELNKRSQNLYAEQLVRAVGRARGGDGSMASARRAVLATLRELGVPESGLVLADGSGLSRLDLVQPRQLAALLRGMLAVPEAETFRRSLPSAGVDGTLRRRFQGAAAARGRVAAKTGYVARVVALSGYVPRRGREPLVFSLLVNDFLGEPAPVQALVDSLVDRLAALAGPAP